MAKQKILLQDYAEQIETLKKQIEQSQEYS